MDRKTSRLLEKALMKLYKRLPCLWHNNHPNHKNPKVRLAAYKKMLKMYRQFSNNKNAKLKYLRLKVSSWKTGVRREYKRKIAYIVQGYEDDYEPKLWYYNQLKFLVEDDFRKTSFEAVSDSDSDTIEGLSKMIKEQLNGGDEDSISTDSGEISESFGGSIALQMMNLEPTQRFVAEKFIAEIMFQARMGNLCPQQCLRFKSGDEPD